MATSAALDRTGPNFSLSILIITLLYFCGLSFAATPREITGRQSHTQCEKACTPAKDAMAEFCQKSAQERMVELKACVNTKCPGDGNEAASLYLLLCTNGEGITTPTSVDMATVTSLVADSPVTVSTATTTTSFSTTISASITPTSGVNRSDSSSGGGVTSNKRGSDLSIPIIVAIAIGGTAFLGMCVGLWYLIMCLKKRKRREREQRNAGNKGFDKSPMIDLAIPLDNASRKEIDRGAPWIDEENNNSTAQLNNTDAMNKPRLPPIATKFAPPVPQRPRGEQGITSSGDVSPVSPVSPLSEYATYDERRSKAISTVSSMKPERTHRDFYDISSPPLPTPASTVASRYPSTRFSTKNKPANLITESGAANRPESEYPTEPVSPLSRNLSAKSNIRSEVSAIGEEQLGWESYRDMIRKYEEHQAQGKPTPTEEIQRVSGLSQFNFGFGESQTPVEAEKKRESSFFARLSKRNTGGHLTVASEQNKDKHISGSSSVYSSQPLSPPPPIAREPGPSTPEMFFGRSPLSYTPPSPPGNAGRSFIGVSQPSSHKPEPPTGGLARANSLRWRREVEAATDQALRNITDSKDDKGKTVQKSSGLWSLLTPKLSGASPKVGTVPSGPGIIREGTWPNVGHQAASSEMSLISEDGKSGVVII